MAHLSHVIPVEHMCVCNVATHDMGVLAYSEAESLPWWTSVCRELEVLGGRSAGELFMVATEKPAKREHSWGARESGGVYQRSIENGFGERRRAILKIMCPFLSWSACCFCGFVEVFKD